jgi:Stage II sporulation protein M
MIGFLTGILFTNIFGKAYILGVGLLGEYFLLHFRYTQINYNSLLAYVFQERIKLFLVISVLGITNIGIPVIGALFVWFGFSGGVLLSVAIMKFGIKGIIICLGAVFPHFLVYIPLYLIYSDKLIDRRVSERNTWKKQKWIHYLLFLLIGVLIITFGVVLESYINPIIFKKILNIVNLNG